MDSRKKLIGSLAIVKLTSAIVIASVSACGGAEQSEELGTEDEALASVPAACMAAVTKSSCVEMINEDICMNAVGSGYDDYCYAESNMNAPCPTAQATGCCVNEPGTEYELTLVYYDDEWNDLYQSWCVEDGGAWASF
jgi:hypothetical protein